MDWKGNSNSIYKTIGASNHTDKNREEHDYYATEPKAAELLCDLVSFHKTIWECACGEGHLSEVFKKRGYETITTDLIYRGYGTGGLDFLKYNEPVACDIVTNPPYKYAKEFVKQALELIPNGFYVAMFLKLTFMEGKARKELFEKYPPKTIFVSSSRLQCAKNGEFEQIKAGGGSADGFCGKRVTTEKLRLSGLIDEIHRMKVLVACEESQAVCKAFREKGHEAYSCDILECSGGHPEWHIMQDVLPLLNGNCEFETTDGVKHCVTGKWDLIIAHPPCTYLSFAGNGYFNVERYGDKAVERIRLREEAAEFFMKFINADCEKIAVENPVGYMNSTFRSPDCIVHPYYFASSDDKENYQMKRTCFWLKNLTTLSYEGNKPKPQPTYIEKSCRSKRRYFTDSISGGTSVARKLRSKTFPAIAKAMAEQWG